MSGSPNACSGRDGGGEWHQIAAEGRSRRRRLGIDEAPVKVVGVAGVAFDKLSWHRDRVGSEHAQSADQN